MGWKCGKDSYNPLRHLQEMEDWIGITKIATDPLGRAQNVQYPDGKSVSYTYGKAGERTSITYPDGKTVYYRFDEQVRLSELKDGDAVITYGYDAAGRLSEKHFPNGLQTAYHYDSKGQIRELIHKDREGILDKYIYQYDLLGNKTGIEKQRRGLEEESGSYKYGYDSLGRLNKVVKDGNPLRAYQYDAFGNRTRLMERGRETTYVYNTMNQLLSRVDADTEETYTYDRRGNLSQITANGQIKNQYLYGALNRLEQAMNGKGEAARYQYNGLGHRVGKEVSKLPNPLQIIPNQIDSLNPINQLESPVLSPEKKIQYTIDLTREYHNLLQKEKDVHIQSFLWDGNVAGMLEDEKNTVSYYLQDEIGSPMRLADEDGCLNQSYGYDEFGQDICDIYSACAPFGYIGYEKDDIAGTYFAHIREYMPDIGRFIGQDLIAGFLDMPFTLNRYGYCFNNPLIIVDIDGAWPKWVENAGKAITNGINKVGNWVKDNKDNLIKVGIGVVGIGVGVAAVALTGGAAAPAVIAGIKVAATVGAVSAATSAGITATKSIISGDDFKAGVKKTFQSAIDGFSEGFMVGGIMFGASSAYTVFKGTSNGLHFGKTPKDDYGRISIGYGRAERKAHTIFSIQNARGQSRFRLDVDLEHFLHLHFGLTNKARKVHRTGIIETIIGIITGAGNTKNVEEICDQ